ncbi:MAG TPA: RNA polymerase sigma factor [Ilumatobacter sp.]
MSDASDCASLPGVLTADDIDGFRRGDSDAVRQVYREYGRLVYAVARNMLASKELAEEATQQTFVKAWQAATSFDTTRALGPWLTTIARRTCIDLHRRESRRSAGNLDDVPGAHPALVTAGPDMDQGYDAWAVRQAIDELPDDERAVVRLQHVEGLSHVEIAEQLGVPVGTVKSRSFRAHRRLAAALGHLREHDRRRERIPGQPFDPPSAENHPPTRDVLSGDW